MINRKSNSGSGMFMMEMLFVVFFFILCASTCISIFVRANNMSRLAKDINQGVIRAESIVESYKADRLEEYIRELSGRPGDDGTYEIYWDKDWNPLPSNVKGAYHARLELSQEEYEGGPLTSADVLVTRVRDGEELCRLHVYRHGKL